MKILSICHDHPEFTAGGTEFVAHDLARALGRLPGVEARFLAATTSLTHPDTEPGSLHAFGEDFLLRTGSYDIFSMRRHDGTAWIGALKRLLDLLQPDVVHLHGLDRIGADVLAVLSRLRPEASLVLTLHDFQLICPNDGLLIQRDGAGLCQRPVPDSCRRCFPEVKAGRHALRKAHLLRLLENVDAFIAPSQAVRDRFLDWGLSPSKIRVLPNAVPQDPQPVVRRARSKPDRFAFFGSMAPHKGTRVLLDAAARLVENGAELSLTLHGKLNYPSVEDSAGFRASLAAAGSRVSLLGPYDRGEIPALMAQTDWVVVPSLWEENAPLVVLEAQRAGRPVICTGLGGLSELVRDGIDGLHVPRGNPAALAETMQSVAADPELWSELASNIRPPMTPQEHARSHFSLFSELQERVSA